MIRRYLDSKKTAFFFITVLLALQLFSAAAWAKPAWPSDTGVMAGAGIVIDMDSGTVLFGQNIHTAYAPASITKLLTALIVAENAGSLDDMVTFSHDAVYNVEADSGNALSLDEGDVLSVRDCLHALLLRSSNQTANALAEYIAGSRDAFAERMNQKLEELGCTESHFANPSGLNDSDQYVTAYDMAKIGRAAFSNEIVLSVASTHRYTLAATQHNPDGLTISMAHKIVAASDDPSSEYYLEGALAGKTGFTSIAGNTQVLYAVRDGRGVLVVILKGTQPQYYFDGRTLAEFGFSHFQNLNISEQEHFLQEQEEWSIGGETYQSSELSLDPEAVITLPLEAEFADAERELVTELPQGSPGTAIALLTYTYDERKIGSALLYGPEPENLPETESSAEAAATEAAGDPAKSESREQEKKEEEKSANWLWALGITGLLVLAAAAGYLVWNRQKREQEEQARRRERRRQRLKEMGYSEEEFEKLVQEHRAESLKKKNGAK